MTTISVVIVSYNSSRVLGHCIQSVLNGSPSGGSTEICVVDNDSEDSSVQLVRDKFPSVTIVENNSNLGFAKAANQAIARANGEFVLLLNPDARLSPGSLGTLVSFMRANPSVGAVGPKVLNADGSFQPQCKRGLPSPFGMLSYQLQLHRFFPKSPVFGAYLATHIDPDQMNQVECLSGSCMMVRTRTLEKVGLLDEDYFMYAEDIDLCYRIGRAGWKIFYLPDSEVVHLGGKGGTQSRPYSSIYQFNRSSFIYFRKNVAGSYPTAFNLLVYAGIGCRFAYGLVNNLPRRYKLPGMRRP